MDCCLDHFASAFCDRCGSYLLVGLCWELGFDRVKGLGAVLFACPFLETSDYDLVASRPAKLVPVCGGGWVAGLRLAWTPCVAFLECEYACFKGSHRLLCLIGCDCRMACDPLDLFPLPLDLADVCPDLSQTLSVLLKVSTVFANAEFHQLVQSHFAWFFEIFHV